MHIPAPLSAGLIIIFFSVCISLSLFKALTSSVEMFSWFGLKCCLFHLLLSQIFDSIVFRNAVRFFGVGGGGRFVFSALKIGRV